MSITAAENALVALVKAHFAGKLKAVESIPSDWDEDTFRRVLRSAPGVFVSYGGGAVRELGQASHMARFVLFVATTHASGELARRHGDAREIGAYAVIEHLVHLLDGRIIDGIGSVTVTEIQNLFSGPIEKQGAAIYGVVVTLPIQFDPDLEPAPTLDDFLTFHGDIDAAPADGQVDAATTAQLET